MTRAGRSARLGVLALAMINVASIVSARNLPVMAEYGWAMLLLFALSVTVFLVPVAMAAAELGTAWPRDGGVYAWVKEAFGGRTGFLAVWCDYAENVAWFPTVLSFIAASLAYAVDPGLAGDRLWLVAVMLVFFWGTTAAALAGARASAAIGAVGTVAGSLLPALLVVALGAAWLLQGNPSQIPFSPGALVPDVGLGNLAFLGGIILLFTGMEMAGFHAGETRDPGRTVPRAIFLAVAITVSFSVLGSLFMAFVLPRHEISLVSGTMELFAGVLDTFSLGWLLAPLALLVALGGVAHLMPWVLGPAKGVAAVAQEGLAPPRLGRTNRNAVPVALLLVQGVAGSVFALLFVAVPSVSTSYWMLSAVTAQVIVTMYALVFAAVIRLRYTQPGTPRPYRIPGGLPGVWLVGGVGLLGCVASFLLGFVPPSQLQTGDTVRYVLLLALATVVLSLPPFVFALLSRRRAGPAPEAARSA
ncbi:amino acid permease [Geodermatophilus marinus]|uniref:amino acid permease n=1 Tax=Geodermatophilus sp. LHW52908 TaxID=2303986 RepID=UPI000E3B5EC3|nr:amino acid permease [Geodermatophilus sp. LHW52908]RFU21633.1 amino acid permease [Geodermatophilus sp. LHW52908]